MFEIISYGGGGLLEAVLNGVAMFFGASSYIYALKIAATLACIGILISSAFSGRYPDLKWMLGIIMIYIFLFVPKVDVTITDSVERAPGGMPTMRVVGNVPVGLAFAASFTSQMPPAALRNELLAHRGQHVQTLATYRLLQDRIAALPVRQRARYRHPEMTLRLGIRCEEAWLAWCDDVTAELERE